jgi:GT2 family glycosyltransferase
LAEQTIRSLYENTLKEDFNLFIYLDGANEETYQAVRSLEFNFNLWSQTNSMGPGWCRNAICDILTDNEQRAHFLYHSDSDVYFLPSWLDALIKAYETFPQVKLFGAGCHPYLHTNLVLEKDGLVVHTKDAIPGFTAFMDWETWDKYGPYDEHKGIMGSEDWAFCQRIVKDGFYVASLWPELVIHCGKTNSDGNPATGHELIKEIPGHPEIKIL